MNKRVPEIGEVLHFFDDGKLHQGRHYMATVTNVVKYENSFGVIVPYRIWSESGDDSWLEDVNLVDVWDIEKEEHDWVYAKETDYFIECSVPKYDENRLWFARTKCGGWFSMDIQSGWQGGDLDTDGELYKQFLEIWNGRDDLNGLKGNGDKL